MLEVVGFYILALVVGAVIGVFIYRNNHSKVSKYFDKVDEKDLDEKFEKLKDEIFNRIKKIK